MLLDGVALYNVDHMLGLFSVFTPEAVKKVTFYKGAFPAKYSGRISSIVDVRTNDGNMNKFSGTVSTGLLSTKFHLDGPIVRGKTSFSFSTRMLNTLLLDRLIATASQSASNYFFYDVNAKITHRFNDKDRLYLSVYNGLDNVYVTDDEDYHDGNEYVDSYYKTGISWGNTVVALRWNHVFGNKVFMNATTYFNRYNMRIKSHDKSNNKNYEAIYTTNYNSKIKDLGLKLEFEYLPSTNHTIQFGAEYVSHNFFPESIKFKEYEKMEGVVNIDTTAKYGNSKAFYGHEFSLYAEDNIKLGSKVIFSPGIHLAIFNTNGKTYFEPEPRVSLKYDIVRNWSIKSAYSRMSQYVHLLSSTQIALPTDLWVPITEDIKPVTSNQYSIGLYYSGMKQWNFTLEGYYKEMKNVLEYKDGAITIGKSSVWNEAVEMGEGRAYGIEFMAQKTEGRNTGWFSYTLAKSDRIFKNGSINNGKRFPFKYDRRHTINAYYNFKVNEKVDINATWTFITGGAITVPKRIGGFINPDAEKYGYGDEVSEYNYVDSRNNYRLPPTHMLNLGINFTKQKKRGFVYGISVFIMHIIT
jgi:Outer membrane receptor for ferrienterochelin and colicins